MKEEDETVTHFFKRSRRDLNEELSHIPDRKRMRTYPGACNSTTSSLASESLGESSGDQDFDGTRHSLTSVGQAQDLEVQSPHAAVAGLYSAHNLPCIKVRRYLTTSSTSAEALKHTLEENSLSLSELGNIVKQYDIGVEDEEYVKSKIADNNIKINMKHIRNMQSSIDGLQTSTDSIVRALTAVVREQANIIAGLSLTVDVLLTKQRDRDKELKKTSFHVTRNQEKTLPKGKGLKRSNISKNWQLQASPPFKELNLTELLEKWRKPARAHKYDHFLHVLDFLRHYFVNACEPLQEIQKYACRQTGKKGKDDTLKDLPESLVDFLIKFVLDALGLPDKELLQSSSEYERNPNRWWLDLAENNEERKRMYNELSEARMTWSGRIRIAMGRALADVRAYHFHPDRAALLPSKKKRIMTSTVNMGLDVVEKTEFADIAVETDVNDTY